MMHGDSRVMSGVFWRQPVYQHPVCQLPFPGIPRRTFFMAGAGAGQRMPRASRIHSPACWISWAFSLAISIISAAACSIQLVRVVLAHLLAIGALIS